MSLISDVAPSLFGHWILFRCAGLGRLLVLLNVIVEASSAPLPPAAIRFFRFCFFVRIHIHGAIGGQAAWAGAGLKSEYGAFGHLARACVCLIAWLDKQEVEESAGVW